MNVGSDTCEMHPSLNDAPPAAPLMVSLYALLAVPLAIPLAAPLGVILLSYWPCNAYYKMMNLYSLHKSLLLRLHTSHL